VVVSNRGDNSVSLIDAQQLRVRTTLPICAQPTDIAILPDNSKAFVACSGSAQVASIDLKTDKVLALLDVGKSPAHLALKPAAQLFDLADEEGAALIQVQAGNAALGTAHA